jgi:competence protein ComEC
MAITYLGARVVDQRSPPLNALAVVAACLVALEPLSVADPAFILTFGATLGILLVAPLANGERTRRLPRWLAPVGAMLAASVATEALLLPVGAIVFSRVTFAGLALNFLAIPLMAVAQIAGMLLVPAALVGRWAAFACGFVAHVGAAGLVRSAELVAFAPAVVFRVAAPGWPAVIIYYLALAVLLSGRARVASALTAFAAGVWIVAEPWTYATSGGDGRLHVTFLDVGQGDSAFVRFPRGATMLVDTGGLVARPAVGGGPAGASGFDIGDRVVAPPLRLAGVRRLDRLVLTHGDPDHIGGAPSLLGEFRPREVWEGIPVSRFEPLTTLRAAAVRLGVPWKMVTAGHRLNVDGVDISVLHPEPADWERQRVRNDDSVVIDIRWGDVSVLLTGDIGRAVERRLSGDLRPSPLRIVKVPHHGSLTSSSAEFVRALRPRVAVFSVGRSNRFGHPALPVLERYVEAGTTVFRTDRDGAVTIDSDGRSIDVRTFNGREMMLRGPP